MGNTWKIRFGFDVFLDVPCRFYETQGLLRVVQSQGIWRAEGHTGRCGLGGKVNTNPGKQNARFKGSKIRATRVIQVGEEIFVPYRRSYRFKKDVVDDSRSGWGVVGRRFYRDMG